MAGNFRGNIPARIGEEIPLFLFPGPVHTSGSGFSRRALTETIPSFRRETLAFPYGTQETPVDIILGTRTESYAPPNIVCNDDDLLRHIGKPWFNSWLEQQHGIDMEPHRTEPGPFALPPSFFQDDPERPSRHAFCVGKAGSGKTRFMLGLLREQLKLGCSAVVMDFKSETVQQALWCALDAGIAKEDIVALSPYSDGAVPGWNPLSVPRDSIQDAAEQFADIVEESTPYKLTKSKDLLINAATVIAAQGLSVVELGRFLTFAPYRDAVLGESRRAGHWDEFWNEHEYFATEYASMSKSEQTAAASAVLNKFRPLLTSPYLSSVLSAPKDTLDLPSLWKRQRVILVHLDAKTGMLASFLARHLQRAAKRGNGPVPVALCLDELESQEALLGKAVGDMLNFARSQNLRVLAACQFLDQLSDRLYASFMTNASLKAFFTLHAPDAKKVSQTLAQGSGKRIGQVELSRDPTKNAVDKIRIAYRVQDRNDRDIVLSQEDAAKIKSPPYVDAHHKDPDGLLRHEVPAAAMGYTELRAWKMPLRKFLSGVGNNWELMPSRGYGDAELLVVPGFYPPKVRAYWSTESDLAAEAAKKLRECPRRHALVCVSDREPAFIRTADMDFPGVLPDIGEYASGRSAEEAARQMKALREQLARLSGQEPPPEPRASAPSLVAGQEDDDDSLP